MSVVCWCDSVMEPKGSTAGRQKAESWLRPSKFYGFNGFNGFNSLKALTAFRL